MHAILVTIQTKMQPGELAQVSKDISGNFQQVKGLLMKTWINYGSILGGFYVFTDEQAAQEYLKSPLIEQGARGLGEVQVAHYAVFDEPSIQTGTPTQSLTDRRLDTHQAA